MFITSVCAITLTTPTCIDHKLGHQPANSANKVRLSVKWQASYDDDIYSLRQVCMYRVVDKGGSQKPPPPPHCTVIWLSPSPTCYLKCGGPETRYETEDKKIRVVAHFTLVYAKPKKKKKVSTFRLPKFSEDRGVLLPLCLVVVWLPLRFILFWCILDGSVTCDLMSICYISQNVRHTSTPYLG